MSTGESISAWRTIARGVDFSPELKEGIWLTGFFAVLATLGRVVVPIAVQQTLDRGLNGPGGPDTAFMTRMAVLAGVAIVVTSGASYLMTSRLFATAERGLATLRIKAFRHVHDLPLLTQNTERRGALVARVTSDVDQVSQFLVFGGMIAVVSVGQIIVATLIMAYYSWQLTLVVWLCFAPLFLSLRYFQRKLSEAYGVVRSQVGVMLSAISEPVVGAAVVRSYAIEKRTQDRIDTAVDRHRAASTRAQGLTAFSFSLGGVSAGLANAGVLIVGIWLGLAGEITAGKVLAFAFLVTLFVGPVQMGTQVLTDAQNAIAGWRRVIGILETPADVVDPGDGGTALPQRPVSIEFDDVEFAYPGGRPVLHDVSLRIEPGRRVAVVGETGSGKTTLAKLLTRLMDPSSGGGAPRRGGPARGAVHLAARAGGDGAAGGLPVRRHAGRQRAVRPARRDRRGDPRGDPRARPVRLAGHAPAGLETRVGQRGSRSRPASGSSSRWSAPTSPTRTCWCSTRRPARSTRSSRCGSARRLERLMSGRTSVTIAHRLSTAENADEVVVVDAGRIVQRGSHDRLVAEGGVYGRLHASWVAQHAPR